MKSYNFDVLESYQSFVHNTAENMGVDVQETWATPAKSYKVVQKLQNVGLFSSIAGPPNS